MKVGIWTNQRQGILRKFLAYIKKWLFCDMPRLIQYFDTSEMDFQSILILQKPILAKRECTQLKNPEIVRSSNLKHYKTSERELRKSNESGWVKVIVTYCRSFQLFHPKVAQNRVRFLLKYAISKENNKQREIKKFLIKQNETTPNKKSSIFWCVKLEIDFCAPSESNINFHNFLQLIALWLVFSLSRFASGNNVA